MVGWVDVAQPRCRPAPPTSNSTAPCAKPCCAGIGQPLMLTYGTAIDIDGRTISVLPFLHHLGTQGVTPIIPTAQSVGSSYATLQRPSERECVCAQCAPCVRA